MLDGLGYVTLMRWRFYGEEGLAGKRAEVWLLDKTLTVEHAGEPFSSYEVQYDARSPGGRGGSGRLLRVSRPTLFDTPFASGQMRWDDGWLKALRLEDYAAGRSWRPLALQQALFPYHEACG